MLRLPKLNRLIAAPSIVAMSCWTAAAQEPPTLAPEPSPVVRPITSPEDDITPLGEDGAHSYESGDEVSRESEVIRERYPSGSIKIERQIAEDAAGNLINNGRWTQWDPQGNVVGMGEFVDGKQHGHWIRYLGQNEGKMFSAPPYKQFSRPFLSEAEFVDGQLHGTWTVVDARKRRIMQCEFANGKPEGVSIWWYASGQKMREVTYKGGKIDGELLEWNQQNQLIAADLYREGRKLVNKIEYHTPGKKKSEGPYLLARTISEETYDWWNAAVTSKAVGKEGVDQRHGLWTWWYSNGMKKMEGTYKEGQPTGKFVWWYQNSQKYLEGEYDNGKQHGMWTWWHQNGLTQFKGEYVNGHQSGRWTGYTEDGKLVEVQDFTAPQALYDSATPEVYGSNDPAELVPEYQATRPTEPRSSRRR